MSTIITLTVAVAADQEKSVDVGSMPYPYGNNVTPLAQVAPGETKSVTAMVTGNHNMLGTVIAAIREH